MVFKQLISFCLVVAMVRSDTTEEISSFVETAPIISSSGQPTLEELKKDGSNPMNNGISPRADSLFGLGIGGNLLGVHAGAGIGHGDGGYGNLGQGFVGKPGGGQYPQYPQYPYPVYPAFPYYAPAPQYPVMPQGMPPARSPTCYRPPCA